MSYNTKNYSEQGGNKLVIGGELEVKEGARVIGLDAGVSVEANPASTGTTNLEKIKIGNTTYKIPQTQGTKYYQHLVRTSFFNFQFVCSYANPFTTQTLANWLRDKGFDSNLKYLLVNKDLSYKEWGSTGYTQVDLPSGGIYYRGVFTSIGFITPNIKIYGTVSIGTGDITGITRINVENADGLGDLTVQSDTVIEL